MKIPLMDIGRQNRIVRGQLDEVWASCVDHSRFIQGEHVARFEEEFASFCGASNAIGCSSGTDALFLALLALGVEQGDEVIVPSMTFAATPEAVHMVGAVPIAVDVLRETGCIDPGAVRAAVSPRTRAVIPVHLHGRWADLETLRSLCDAHQLAVISDAAQAHGLRRAGRPVEELSDVSCYSFYPGKNLGALGDAGACTTNRGDLAKDMRARRNHGRRSKYEHEFSGVNVRMDEIQAGALSVKLRRLPDWTRTRRQVAELYCAELGSVPGITVPTPGPSESPVWHIYAIETERRDELKTKLKDEGVATGIHYPIPIHEQPAFRGRVGDHPCPESERRARQTLSIPCFESMTVEDARYVIDAIKRCLA